MAMSPDLQVTGRVMRSAARTDASARISKQLDVSLVPVWQQLLGTQHSAEYLRDAMQGQRWEQIQPHFDQFWTMTFRVLDDVKVPGKRCLLQTACTGIA